MYNVIRLNGKFAAIVRSNSDGSATSFDQRCPEWREFLNWNAAQPVPLDFSDKPPEPPTAKEIEAARKFAVALQIIKAVPDGWETGTPQQQIQWASKQLFKRVAQEID